MFKITQIDNHTILTAETLLESPRLDWFQPNYWRQQNAIMGEKKGRAATYFINFYHQLVVLRHYWRGGLIGKVLSDQYLYLGLANTRVYKEFDLLCQLQQLGLPVAEPVAAKVTQHGLIYRGDIITKAINGAQSLLDMLKQKAIDDSCIAKIANCIAAFHKQGVYHADLNINNILFDSSGQVYLIDFDRGVKLTPKHTKLSGNIERLKRSFDKELNRQAQFYWQPSQWQLFLDTYKKALND